MNEQLNQKYLSVSQGSERLAEIIGSFAKEVTQYHSSNSEQAPQLAIKATAGLGKTTQIIKQLISYSALNDGDVHYYVPNHRLSNELVKSLSEELDLNLNEAESFSRVKVIAGRSQRDEIGNPLCQKSELAESLAKVNLNVSKSLCDNGISRCEFYDNCAYQNQFEPEGLELEWPKGLPSELFNDVTVLTHANLFLQTHKRLRKPSLIVIDEAFYQNSKNVIKVNAVELYADDNPISKTIVNHLRNGDINLLSKLKELGYTGLDLIKEAEKIDAIHKSDNQQITISPSLNTSKQKSLFHEVIIKIRASLVLKAIAQEMTISDRAECHCVSYDNKNEIVLVHERRELTIPEDVPTVFIDADVQKQILDKLRKGIKYEQIDVERIATFYQATDLTFSKNLLTNSDNKTDKTIEQIKQFINYITKDGATLVICTKTVRAKLTDEYKEALGQESKLGLATIIHFGNLRGLNEYSDYKNLVLVGREQINASDAEDNARSLFWDDNKPINFLQSKGKNKPFEKENRLIQLKDGSTHLVSVLSHPDKRVQLLMEQSRECESLQAIDRLRLLRPNKFETRNIYILSSIPLGIPIDYVFSWTQLQKLIDLIEEAKGVIPLNPKHLVKRCPKTATSERTAKRLIQDLKEANPLIDMYIREMALFSIQYRITNKGKYSLALVSKEINDKDRDNILSSILGIDTVEIRQSVN
jgi:hypothetical protein